MLFLPPAQILPSQSSRVAPELPCFEFHSGFWMNLHHLLCEQARRRLVAQGAKLWGPPPMALAPEPTALEGAEQRAWDAALATYARYASKDLLFDEDLGRIKQALARQEDAKIPEGLPEDLRDALLAAAPVYRVHGWKAQDAANRAWAAARAADLLRLHAQLRDAVAKDFATAWPASKVRVELVPVAGWAGAYTTTDPTFIVLGTADPRDQADQGFEILFHEASHGLSAKLEADLAKLGAPGDLWHAVLFDTVGCEVAKALPGHVPYAETQGLWTRAWPTYHDAIVKAWRPWIEGKRSYDAALKALVAALPAADSK